MTDTQYGKCLPLSPGVKFDILDSSLDAIMHAYKDQTIKADLGKAQMHLVPIQILYDIANVRKYGNDKYGDSESWRRVEPVRYVDAMMRHALQFMADPKSVDEESKLPHLWHLACNVAFLCELYKEDLK